MKIKKNLNSQRENHWISFEAWSKKVVAPVATVTEGGDGKFATIFCI